MAARPPSLCITRSNRIRCARLRSANCSLPRWLDYLLNRQLEGKVLSAYKINQAFPGTPHMNALLCTSKRDVKTPWPYLTFRAVDKAYLGDQGVVNLDPGIVPDSPVGGAGPKTSLMPRSMRRSMTQESFGIRRLRLYQAIGQRRLYRNVDTS
jgi:hypothetical protein